MSITDQEIKRLLELDPAEEMKLAHRILDRMQDPVGSEDEGLSHECIQLLESRLAYAKAHPEELTPWEEAWERLCSD